MEILKTVLMILLAIDCIALTIVVLLQEGKSAGLGTIGGMADSYWGQNNGRYFSEGYQSARSIIYPACAGIESEGICIRR